MKLAITTIQRNRAPWVEEWVAFHYLIGFRKFYFFAHRCVDDTLQVLFRLRNFFDIEILLVPGDLERPQLPAYGHAYKQFGAEVDWMAFIDGDEFLFPTVADDLRQVLEPYARSDISALGIFWLCFGSNGHIDEPAGLITENYIRRAPDNFMANRHVKSLVRGGLAESFRVSPNPHIFYTPKGTFDELMRPVTRGVEDMSPTHQYLRINHYVCQSLKYFKNIKQPSGTADGGQLMIRPDSWWTTHDRNEVVDTTISRFLPALKALLQQVKAPGSDAAALPTGCDS
jgi:hypothetical protein